LIGQFSHANDFLPSMRFTQCDDDSFKSTPNSVLLATDIAARGLDIPAVDHVVHFQIPRSADTYIHRSGRTARAMNKGFSMLVIGPDERRVVKALMGSLSRGLFVYFILTFVS
jgi:superfamily II DNA/RNA helicase